MEVRPMPHPLALSQSPHLQLPLSDPVIVFALAMIAFATIPALFERLRAPGIIGLIIAGAAVGPNGLNLLERGEAITLLGTVGLLYLMFMAGVEIDLNEFTRYRARSLGFGVITFAIPLLLGLGLARMLEYGWASSILLASMLASHTLLAYPAASRLGIAKNAAVTTAVGGTIVTDLASLLVLAVVAASVEGELSLAFWLRMTLSIGVFGALVLLGLPRLGQWFFRSDEEDATGEYVFVLAALFSASALAALAGVEPIIGAFLAGLALNRLIPEGTPLNNRLHFFGNAVFIPFFLLSVGMLVDVRVLGGGAQVWKVMGGMTAAVVAGKWLAARIGQRWFGYSPAEGWIIFGLSVPQAAATLAAALIGFRIELFDVAILNGTIMMILVTCTLGPWIVERFGRRVAREEEEKAYEPGDAPQRIVIPMANGEGAPLLLDLALMVRRASSDEPLLPLSVVPGNNRGAAEHIARAEKLLSSAVVYGAGADVPVVPLTRVDRSAASGIIRGLAESRATTVVAGWSGRSRRFGTFGPVLDELVERTEQELLIAHLRRPLNTVTRLVVLLPSSARHSRGFPDAVSTLKLLANRLGASLDLRLLDGDEEGYRRRFEEIRPEAPVSARTLGGWSRLEEELRGDLSETDLLVLVSARRGTIAWDRELRPLPCRMARAFPQSILVLFPSEVVSTPERRREEVLPRSLTPERVVFDLPQMPYPQAVEHLLRTEISDPERLRELRAAVVDEDRKFYTELRPGVGIAHARIEDLPESLLFLGISEGGIAFPQVEQPARLLFLLLTPRERPYEHLEHLASITQALGYGGRVESLSRCQSTQDLYTWFRAAGDATPPGPAGPRSEGRSARQVAARG